MPHRTLGLLVLLQLLALGCVPPGGRTAGESGSVDSTRSGVQTDKKGDSTAVDPTP
jgi:hypothetical protein